MSVYITKSDGTTELFDAGKLKRSLAHAGATGSVAAAIAKDIESELWGGVSTQEIYARAFKRLREHRHGVAARYSLKRSIMDFGPSGFPFEVYVSELFRAEGFDTKIDQLVQGACVEHEVDVIVERKDELLFAEAKFHNTVGFRTDLKTALYISARITDIREALKARGETRRITGLMVTNTKFTDKALQYAQCQGLEVLGWDNPQGNTLHDRIEHHRLYPVTALTSLNPREKMALLSRKIVLCKSLKTASSVLRQVGVPPHRFEEVLREADTLVSKEKDIL